MTCGLALLTGGLAACGDDGGTPLTDAAEPVHFLVLGQGVAPDIGVDAAYVGSTEAQRLADALAPEASEASEARQALTASPPAGTAGLAFLLSGCPADGAELVETETEIRATLVDPAEECVALQDYLVTFQVPEDLLPEDGRPIDLG